MDAIAQWLFDPAGLTPHGFCLLWEPELIWLHAGSDIAIGLAYFTIPLALIVFLRRRHDLEFRPVFSLFAAFILLCGAGHWINLVTLWVPAYGLEGVVKAATALASVGTAIVLWRLLPEAMAVPSPGQLRDANAALDERRRHSHDLKAPLRAIANLAQWTTEDAGPEAAPEMLANLHLMRQRVRRMDLLLDGLLEYSRAGHDKAPAEPMEIGALVAEIVESLAPPSGFVVRFASPPVVVCSPRAPLEHVLQNLIANAIKHHDRAGGEVAVSVRVADGWAEVRVADDGPGIAPQHHQRIFAIFQTLEGAEDSTSGGVGLSIVQKMVERVGGRAWVESAPPARGSVFAFTWPTGLAASANPLPS